VRLAISRRELQLAIAMTTAHSFQLADGAMPSNSLALPTPSADRITSRDAAVLWSWLSMSTTVGVVRCRDWSWLFAPQDIASWFAKPGSSEHARGFAKVVRYPVSSVPGQTDSSCP
jgi:hypothetical protein